MLIQLVYCSVVIFPYQFSKVWLYVSLLFLKRSGLCMKYNVECIESVWLRGIIINRKDINLKWVLSRARMYIWTKLKIKKGTNICLYLFALFYGNFLCSMRIVVNVWPCIIVWYTIIINTIPVTVGRGSRISISIGITHNCIIFKWSKGVSTVLC